MSPLLGAVTVLVEVDHNRVTDVEDASDTTVGSRRSSQSALQRWRFR